MNKIYLIVSCYDYHGIVINIDEKYNCKNAKGFTTLKEARKNLKEQQKLNKNKQIIKVKMEG